MSVELAKSYNNCFFLDQGEVLGAMGVENMYSGRHHDMCMKKILKI